MSTIVEYDPITGLPIGAEYSDHNGEKSIIYDGKTYLTDESLMKLYRIVYQGNRMFTNKDTNKSMTIERDTKDFLNIGGTIYINSSKLSELIGE